MVPVITLLMVLALMVLVTRIAAIALTYTGMSHETARFQALSAFTGAGFTTKESEQVVNHPVRRRIMLTLLVLGNAGIVTAVSSLILTFIRSDGTGSIAVKISFLFGGLIVLWFVAASRWADRVLSRIVGGLLKRYTRLDVQDYSALLHLAGEYQVSELVIEPDDWLEGKSVVDSDLRKEGLLVLGIRRGDGVFRGIPDTDTRFEAGDTLIIYGRATSVALIDDRKSGKLGDIEHFDAVLEEKRIEEEEKQRDPSETGSQDAPPPSGA
ncbi:MAG: TrkA C-terminal domain-containing protein [Elusimicrobiota bacterium]